MDSYRLKEYMNAYPDAKLRDLVEKLLHDDIISLRIAPGTKLNVNQIAASLGISRTPVVEAVADLAEAGFVVSRPGQVGSFVLDLSLSDMMNLYRVRTAIESEAAALCAHNADDATVHQMSILAEAFKESVVSRDIRGMKETDMPFHKLIIESCGNPYIVQTYRLIEPKLTMYQSSMLEFITRDASNGNPWLPSVKYNHVSVVSAIRLRLPDIARKAMDDHVTASLSFTSLSGNDTDPFRAFTCKPDLYR